MTKKIVTEENPHTQYDYQPNVVDEPLLPKELPREHFEIISIAAGNPTDRFSVLYGKFYRQMKDGVIIPESYEDLNRVLCVECCSSLFSRFWILHTKTVMLMFACKPHES